MTVGRAVLVGATVLCACAACASDSAAPAEWASLLAAHPCAGEAAEALTRMGARDQVLRAPPAPAADRVFRIPTRTVGEWIRLQESGAGPPAITRVSGEGIEALTFSEGCETSLRGVPSAHSAFPVGPGRFTDEDLRLALRADAGVSATVVYVWSPHMSLSVDGWPEVSAACEALGLGLVPVLFPEGDQGFAEREATRAGIPLDGLKEAASVELVFRDALVHAPAIVVFAGDRVSPVLPGYRDAAGYRRFLEDFLSGG